jgi:UDP:flavonoid glycosyltransferase YjiC (YdhE family)
VGINLGGRNPGAEKIGQAVDKIIKNSSFRKKAKTLSEQYHKYDVGRVFDEIVQEVVRDWNKKKMSSQK